MPLKKRIWSLERGLVYFVCGKNINNQDQCADYSRSIALMTPLNKYPIVTVCPISLYSSPTSV